MFLRMSNVTLRTRKKKKTEREEKRARRVWTLGKNDALAVFFSFGTPEKNTTLENFFSLNLLSRHRFQPSNHASLALLPLMRCCIKALHCLGLQAGDSACRLGVRNAQGKKNRPLFLATSIPVRLIPFLFLLANVHTHSLWNRSRTPAPWPRVPFPSLSLAVSFGFSKEREREKLVSEFFSFLIVGG